MNSDSAYDSYDSTASTVYESFDDTDDEENVRSDYIGYPQYFPDPELMDLATLDFDIYNDLLHNEDICKNSDDDDSSFDDDSSREQIQIFFHELDVTFEDFHQFIRIEEVEHGQYLLTMFDILCEALQRDSETSYERGDFENMLKLQCIHNSEAYWKMALYANNLYDDYLLPENFFGK
jgi:hypothetical protein